MYKSMSFNDRDKMTWKLYIISSLGERTRQVYCAKKNAETQVEDFNCGDDKPIDREECNTQACPSRYRL